MVDINEIRGIVDENIGIGSRAYIRVFIDKKGVTKYRQIAIEKIGHLAGLPRGEIDSYISVTKDNKIVLLFQQYGDIEAIKTKASSGRMIKVYIPSIIARRALPSVEELGPGMHRIPISGVEEIYDGGKLVGLLLSLGE